MSLMPKPEPRPATFEVSVFPDREEDAEDSGIESYSEHFIIDKLRLPEDQLEDFVAGYQRRARRWFELQRRARQLVGERGYSGPYHIALDWLTDAWRWPYDQLCPGAANLNLSQAETMLSDIKWLVRAAPEWSIADLGGKPFDAAWGDPEHKNKPDLTVRLDPASTALLGEQSPLLTISWPGDEQHSPRVLERVPVTAKAKEIRAAFKRLAKPSAQLEAWAQTQPDEPMLWTSLRQVWGESAVSVKLTAARGPWENRQEAVSHWKGDKLDVSQLELPSFDVPHKKLLEADEVMRVLRETYDFDGPVPGHTLYHSKYPMFGFDC